MQQEIIMDQDQKFKGQCQPIILECQRCGELFSSNHVCKAISRRCYCCDKFGHYSKFCLSRKSNRSATQQPRSSPSGPLRQKPKSARKQQRDISRLLEFREKKTLCASLPFYELANDKFNSFVRRSQCNMCSDIRMCSVKSKSVENQVVSSLRQISSLQEENQILRVMVVELNNSVEQEQRRRQNAESDNAVTLENAAKKHQSELSKKEQELAGKSAEILKLQCDLKNQSSETNALKQETDNLSSDRKKLYDIVLKLTDLEENSVMKLDAVKEEFENVTEQFYGGCWSEAPRRRQPCRNCGSSNNHHPADCLAKGNQCKNCNKLNHFTSLCKAQESLIPKGADDAEIAFMEKMFSSFQYGNLFDCQP